MKVSNYLSGAVRQFSYWFVHGTLGFADVNVRAHYMQLPQYIGVAAMITGIVFGILGLKDDR